MTKQREVVEKQLAELKDMDDKAPLTLVLVIVVILLSGLIVAHLVGLL